MKRSIRHLPTFVLAVLGWAGCLVQLNSAAAELKASDPVGAEANGLFVQQQPEVTNALPEQLQLQLDSASRLRRQGQFMEAERLLVELLGDQSPEIVRQQALIELALGAKAQGDLARALEILSQFVHRWPADPHVPEVLLRQGQLFRQAGLNNLALAKFYAVMTSALVIKKDTLDYYQNLVLQAQTEIAETHYLQGKHAEAADFFARLLKQNNPALNRPPVQFRLVRSLSALRRDDDAVAQGQDFLARYPEHPDQPEVRFHLAMALRRLGRNNEALQQVMYLLQEQKQRGSSGPGQLSYWQQRAGNEIGNLFYQAGDYARALEIYLALNQLDNTPAWQLPAMYQIGLTCERLSQPDKALGMYREIARREKELPADASPGLRAVVEMARWRAEFVSWQSRAELSARPPAITAPGI